MGNTILVVDDEPGITDLVKLALEPRGYRVLTARDGPSAFELAVSERPDLVLSDLLLPRMHGFELCKRIKAVPELKHTIVIMMTAVYKTSKYRGEAHEQGADDFFHKPFTASEVLERVAKYVRSDAEPPRLPPPDVVQQQFLELRRHFAEKFPQRADSIDEAWKKASESAWDRQAFRELHRSVHGLTGSGTTFGYPAVSEAARAAEGVMNAVAERKNPPTDEWRRQIGSYVANLTGVLRSGGTPQDVSAAEPIPEEAVPVDLSSIAPAAEVGATPPPSNEAMAAGLETRPLYLLTTSPETASDLHFQLGFFGYRVEAFRELGEMKAAAAGEQPLAFVIDAVASEDGLEGIEHVTQIQAGAKTLAPVIFLASRSDVETRLEAVRAGGSAYFVQPVDSRDVVERIEALTVRTSPDPARVLIVEDDEHLSTHYTQVLTGAGMTAVAVTDPMAVLQPLDELNPDLILMDIYMPGCSGLELAKVIRQHPDYVSVPIVFLSSELDLGRQIAAMSTGADGFLVKPIRDQHLVSAVNHRVKRSRSLRSLMERDSLTGLFNQSAFRTRFDAEVARVHRQNGRLVFAAIDIDAFTSINDTHGHLAGDRVLKALSRLLVQRLRRTDIVGRLGGDTSALILLDTDGPAAQRLLDEARIGFSRIRQQSERGPFFATLSCGLAEFPTFLDPATLWEAADRALCEAKSGRGDRVVLAGNGKE